MPLVAFSNVVLPEPFGPIRPTSWPFAIAKDTESSAWFAAERDAALDDLEYRPVPGRSLGQRLARPLIRFVRP